MTHKLLAEGLRTKYKLANNLSDSDLLKGFIPTSMSPDDVADILNRANTVDEFLSLLKQIVEEGWN